jgi:hypothetical protein
MAISCSIILLLLASAVMTRELLLVEASKFHSAMPSIFYVGGDNISLTSIHPGADWLFRATLDTSALGNWTNLLPSIAQSGQGDFCEQGAAVPSGLAG